MGRAVSRAAALLMPVLLSVATLAQAPRPAIDVDALGPQVGEPVPQFRLPDQNGVDRTLEDIVGPQGAILIFHRSADW